MSYTIRCYTLFDTTTTGVTNRRPPVNGTDIETKEWLLKRNQQANYDTIIQVASLRAQPENATPAVKTTVNFKEFQNFGFLFDEEEDQDCYKFEFTINHKNVYDDGITELGALYSDCSGVPMIKLGTEWAKLPAFIDITPELKNIHFEVISEED